MSKPSKRSGTGQNLVTPWGSRYWPAVVFLILGFFTADLVILNLRAKFLPTQAPPPKPARPFMNESAQSGNYQTIVTRNIFSSENVIPEALRLEGDNSPQDVPVLSSLPITLVGTLVHSDPEKSIAAIELKGKSQILSFRVKQDVDGIATVEKIERAKVIIRNTNNGRLEFIELPAQTKLAFESGKSVGGSEIKQVAEGQFELKRTDLDKYLNDLPNLLMQARAVPARRPGTGETYGFRVLEVQPDSVLAKIVNPMDVITCVNGSPVTSIQQAMELYNAMKNSPRVCMCLERDGRKVDNCYSIR